MKNQGASCNPHEQTFANKIGKILAKPLSCLVANSRMERFSRFAELYWCILLGKGAGTGWAMEAEIKAAKSAIRRSAPVIFDVGANTGEWSVAIKQLYPQAQLVLFEPQPACQQIIIAKQISGSVLIPKAVSATAGQTVKLFTSGDTAGLASLHERRDSCFNDLSFTSLDVATVTIDDVIRDQKITCVDFMKMDVEGHEFEVLKGARKSMEGLIIKALSFEFGSGNINSRTYFRDFWDLLNGLGYAIYRILPSARLMPIKEYYEDCEYFRGATNYVAILHKSS